MRLCFEELGPTFIKLGQILSTRSDLFSASYIQEFKKLQDQVPAVSFDKLSGLLTEQYPQGTDLVFEWIETKPIGSASIAQVHRAKLKTGEAVVLKIQKPGIEKIISEDIEVMRFIADYVDSSMPEMKFFGLKKLVEEFALSIQSETQFMIEANSVRRFYENFKGQKSILIPQPFLHLSGSKVLVLEYISGQPLSEIEKITTPAQREQLLKQGLQAYFSMVFRDGLFHGDLHAGNILVVDQERLAFIDFGMVGRLSKRLQTSIANMFLALANEDYDRLASEYVDLASPFVAVDKDSFSNDLSRLVSPYFGLSLKNVNIGKILLDSANIASRHQLFVPSELLLFFKSIVTIEGLGRTLKEDFDLLPFVYDYSSEIVKLKYDPALMAADLGAFSREATGLLRVLPGEIKNYFRKLNHPSYAQTIHIKNLDVLAEAQIKSAKIIFFALVLASLIVSATLYVALVH